MQILKYYQYKYFSVLYTMLKEAVPKNELEGTGRIRRPS